LGNFALGDVRDCLSAFLILVLHEQPLRFWGISDHPSEWIHMSEFSVHATMRYQVAGATLPYLNVRMGA
jgi:hypothetical protein